jgi:hypothetical protein
MSTLTATPTTFEMNTLETPVIVFDPTLILLPAQNVTAPVPYLYSLTNAVQIANAFIGSPSVANNLISIQINGAALKGNQSYRLVVTFLVQAGETLAGDITVNCLY